MDKMEGILEQIQQSLATNGETSHGARLNGSENSSPWTPFVPRYVKLDFPRFDGTDVLHFIFKAEQFFDLHPTPEEQKIPMASLHLDREVVPWFQMMQRNNPFLSWQMFLHALEMEFGPTPFESPRAAMYRINQQGSVQDYYLQFTALANRSHGVSPNAVLECFMGGLKPEIKREVLAQNPMSLVRAVSLAKLFEEKYIYKPKQQY